MELNCLKGGAHALVEKPVSASASVDFAKYAAAVEAITSDTGLVYSVGYMFRYARASQRAQELIREHTPGRPVACTLARYNCAYESIAHQFWWDERTSGGPIAEQGTHFVDLARFFGGDALPGSVQGLTLPAVSVAGAAAELTRIPSPVDESVVPEALRVPRVSVANWRWTAGGVASFTHGALLHQKSYEATMEIWSDGLRITLRDLYTHSPSIAYRLPGQDGETVETFENDDPYLTEDIAFVDAATGAAKAADVVVSPFADAAKTYLLTLALRDATKAGGDAAEAELAQTVST